MLPWVEALLADNPQPLSGNLAHNPKTLIAKSENAPKDLFLGITYDQIPS